MDDWSDVAHKIHFTEDLIASHFLKRSLINREEMHGRYNDQECMGFMRAQIM